MKKNLFLKILLTDTYLFVFNIHVYIDSLIQNYSESNNSTVENGKIYFLKKEH